MTWKRESEYFRVTQRQLANGSLQHKSAPLPPRTDTALPEPTGPPCRGLHPPPPTPSAPTTGQGERSPAIYRHLHGPHVQPAVPSFTPWGLRALLCPGTPPAMEARERHPHECWSSEQLRGDTHVQCPGGDTPSSTSGAVTVMCWSSCEEIPHVQAPQENLVVEVFPDLTEGKALGNVNESGDANEHAPQENLAVEVFPDLTEGKALGNVNESGDANEHGFTEDLPVNPACDKTEETPCASKVALPECESDCLPEAVRSTDAEENTEFPVNQNDAILAGGMGTTRVVRNPESSSPSADDHEDRFQAGEGVKPCRRCSCILRATGGDELSSFSISLHPCFEMQPATAPFETLLSHV